MAVFMCLVEVGIQRQWSMPNMEVVPADRSGDTFRDVALFERQHDLSLLGENQNATLAPKHMIPMSLL